MRPTRKHVKRIEDKDAAKFASWFRTGFENLELHEKHILAFEPLNYFVGRNEDITAELKYIYDLLSGTAKNNFRAGISAAISSIPPEVKYFGIIKELLHLAGRVNATEAIPILLQQVGSGFFGRPDLSEGQELFALSLDIISGMAPAEGISNAIRCMVGSSYFHYSYAPRAFIALCRSEPGNFPWHMQLLRKNFSHLHQVHGNENAYMTTLRFARYVDLKTVADNFWGLDLSLEPSRRENNDHWFANELLIYDHSPLILYKKQEQYFFSRHDNNNVEFEVNTELDLDRFDQLYDIRRFLNRILEKRRVHWHGTKLKPSHKEMFIDSSPLYSENYSDESKTEEQSLSA